jgi:3-methyladenine DNA glycosylase AlkD
MPPAPGTGGNQGELMVDEIQKQLAALGNPRDAEFLQRYFKTGPGQYGAGDKFRGIRVPVLRKLSLARRGLPLDSALRLLQSPFHEDRLLALLILVLRYAKADRAAQLAIYRAYLANTHQINNWDLVDSSAEHIVGAYLWERDREPLEQLARSVSLWERRIAVLSTFHYIKRGSFDSTLHIAQLLLTDREDLIHKAVGWMLREVGKRDQAREEAFLTTHHKTMPRTMLRYAIERFPAEKRLGYLKGCLP